MKNFKAFLIIIFLSLSNLIADTGVGISEVGTLSSIPANLSLDSKTIDIGTHLPGDSFSSYFIVKNDSGITSVLNGNITESSAWITSLNPASFSLQYNETDTIFFSGNFPTAPDSFSTLILITSNSGSDSVLVTGKLEATGLYGESLIPSKFFLRQNYPNPFNPYTTIDFGLSKSTFVNLEVYNSIGQKVTTLINENMNTGSYKVKFDASNLSSGIYYYKIQAGENVSVKKMLLIQ